MPRSYFEPDSIRVVNCPFSRGYCAISPGVFIKNVRIEGQPVYEISSQVPVDNGVITKLDEIYISINASHNSKHTIITGDYGQGKSFLLKYVQDVVYRLSNDGIIGYIARANVQYLKENRMYFREKLMSDIEKVFGKLDQIGIEESKITTAKNTYELNKKKSFEDFLKSYDSAFRALDFKLFIFIDEIDRIVQSDASGDTIRFFLEDLKTIAEVCEKSISSFISATPNCELTIRNMGRDYLHRYKPIRSPTISERQTRDYINTKCKTLLKKKIHYPYTNNTKKLIFDLTGGQIRFIERVCAELWEYSSKKKAKIDKKLLQEYLDAELSQSIQIAVRTNIENCLINFISRLMLNKRCNVHMALRGFKESEKEIIKKFVETRPNIILRVGDIYRIDDNIRQQILNNWFGVD